MNVRSICSRRLVTINPQLDLKEAAALMREEHVGFLVVVPAEPRALRAPIGVITDRDIVVSAIAQGVDPTAIKVGEVMSHQPAVAAESDAIDAALKTMQRMGVRRVPVVNGQGELVGVLSLDDLLGFVAGEVDGLARLVRNGRQIEGVLRS